MTDDVAYGNSPKIREAGTTSLNSGSEGNGLRAGLIACAILDLPTDGALMGVLTGRPWVAPSGGE
jgi:hypothetical protein